MMARSLDDVCLEIYLGELPPVDYYGYTQDDVYRRLEDMRNTAREVNTGIWAQGYIRNQSLKRCGYDPEVIMTMAAHEYMRDRDYNGC